MKISNEDFLFKKYSYFFNSYPDLKNSLICFGFEVEDGWFDLLDNLFGEMIECVHDMSKAGYLIYDDFPEILQVKSKFGQLRVYMSSYHKPIEKLIEEYTLKSLTTCEFCGKLAKGRDIKGWYYTVCDEHAKELERG